ncbi:MAG: SSS family solute:Na+ symporter, partial [Nonlabens sp.]
GAMAALITGLAIGSLRFVLEQFKDNLSGIIFDFADFNFLHFAIFLFVICSAVLVVVSLMTPAPPAEKTDGITYERGVKSESSGKRNDAILTIILIGVIVAIWIYFS